MTATPQPTYTPLAFVAARGIPQTVAFDAAGHQLRVSLLAAVSDIPALRSLSQTTLLFDGRALESQRPTSVPSDERELYTAEAHDSLAPAVLRPFVVVREGQHVIGSAPVLVGTPFRVGSNTSLLVELLFDALQITSGSITQPGDFGSVISAGIRVMTSGVERFETVASREEEDLYGTLA
jgi:hypothetical protein